MATKHSSGNPLLDHPGIVASVFAVLVLVGFLAALYGNVTGHHEGGEHPAAGHEGAAAPAGEHH